METIFTSDTFDAIKQENGILLKERGKGAKKFGMIAMIAGAVFVAVSFLDLSSIVPEIIYNFFFYTFRWGGYILMGIGLVTLILKGYVLKGSSVMIDTSKREINLRGKQIPFGEIDNISIESHEVFGRKMSMLILVQMGKKKALVPGSIVSKDVVELEKFIANLNQLIK
jgi:hypothetical protein